MTFWHYFEFDFRHYFELMLEKFIKLQSDIKFTETCKKEYLVSTFANVKLANKRGNKRLKLRL